MADREPIHLSSDPVQAGLQVYYPFPAGLEPVSRDHEGLQALTQAQTHTHNPSFSSTDSDGKEHYDPRALSQPQTTPRIAFNKRRKLWIALASLLLIVLILGIVLGAVLGTQRSQANPSTSNNSNASNSSTSTTDSQSHVSNARIASTSGAWNGTGISMILTPHLVGGSQGIVAFQDFKGALNLIPWSFVGDQNFQLPSPAVHLPFDILNGSALAGAWTDDLVSKFSNYILVYVDPDGLLHDIWANSTTGLNTWSEGNLSSMGWKAPVNGSRATLQMNWDPFCFGKSFGDGSGNAGGMRLWAGGADGKVHQYSFDMPSRTWAAGDYMFEGLSAHGGLKRYTGNQAGNCINNTLFATDAAGELVYVNQDMNNQTNWPVGGAWGDVVRSGRSAVSADSSVAEGKYVPSDGQDYVYYPGQGGKLWGQNVDGVPSYNSNPTGLFTTLNTQIGDVDVMPGTEFGEFLTPTQALLVFQNNGSSLNYAVVSSATNVQQGNLLH